MEHVETALRAVTATVFPHRALETQKLWMTRRMYKPADLSTRQTAAAINRLNNALPLFPGGTENAKFSAVQIIELLEWSLPTTWRTKFNLDGYVPTMHSKMKLIEACKAIEQNEVVAEKPNKTADGKKSKRQKNGKSKFTGKRSERKNDGEKSLKYYCTEHGKNPTHNTLDCYTLKNRAKLGSTGHGGTSNQKTFSNKNFCKEINLLARKSTKKKVLDLYNSAIQREIAKLAKKSSKRKERAPTSDSSDSDSDISVNAIAEKSVSKKANLDINSKEQNYQKKVSWLRDHGSDSSEHEDPYDSTDYAEAAGKSDT